MRLATSLATLLLITGLTTTSWAQDDDEDVFHGQGVLAYRSEDGQTRLWLDGRIFLDAAFYSDSDNPLANGAELRRARLGFKAVFWKDWAAELDIGFADDEVEVKDAWIAYLGLERALVKIGSQKENFSLEELTSSRLLTFMERALPNVFALDRHLGVSYSKWADRLFFAGGFFGEELSDVDETGEDDGYGMSARLAWTPRREENQIVHLGLSGALRTPDADSGERVRFRTRPETHVNRGRFLNTGRIRDVDQYTLLGFETAIQIGSVRFQGEYITSDVQRSGDRVDATLDGWYAYVSWFPSGDRQPYWGDAAEFGRVVPKTKRGAFEVALRYSTADLTDLDASVEGGSSDIVTLGLNWYANANIRFMLNLSHVDNDELADGNGDFIPNDSFEVAQIRFQLHL